MLDIKFIREYPEEVKRGVKNKGIEVDIDRLLKLDEKRRKLLQEVEGLRAKQNKATEEIARKKGGEERNGGVEKMKKLKKSLKEKEEKLKDVTEKLEKLMFGLPNMPLEGVPVGNESKNEVVRKWGEPPQFDFEPKDHVELGKNLDIIDIERAAKVSGSGFGYLKGGGALLELALVRFAMDRLTQEGFVPVIPPVLIRQQTTEGLGYWQAGGNENFYLVKDFQLDEAKKEKGVNLYLVGTAEHALVPMHKNEILDESELPKKYVAFSSCFRRERGSYGKDVHGILRVHQFDKVEMVAFVKPEDDEKERRKLLELVEIFMKDLELPYQVVKLASQDLAFPIAETIDIETWIPSLGKYRETHSISTSTDFQARRLGIRFKSKKEKQTRFVHILNGTAFAIGRTLIAIIENYQTRDGKITVPDALTKYTGFDVIR